MNIETSRETNGDSSLDAVGLICPEPVFRVRRRLATMRAGNVLRVLTDDPLAELDLAVFCQRTGHELIESRDCDGVRISRIRKADDSRGPAETAHEQR